MNLQIFGTKKSSDTRKAERFFKERGVKYQYIDLNEKGLSRGELSGVCRAVGGAEKPNALGTMIGALLVSTLENGLTICAVPFYVLPAVKGAVLALALVAAYATKKEQ